MDFLIGDGIDRTAFTARGRSRNAKKGEEQSNPQNGFWETLKRRTMRFLKEGYFLDVKVLEECVRANVGDLTFEEAYSKTKRVLNITVATSGRDGFPNLLNYITAPNVVRYL